VRETVKIDSLRVGEVWLKKIMKAQKNLDRADIVRDVRLFATRPHSRKEKG
jgi:hypothetical protein